MVDKKINNPIIPLSHYQLLKLQTMNNHDGLIK